MFFRTWWLKSKLNSRNPSKQKRIESKLTKDDRAWVSVILRKLIWDASLEVRNASVRILNQKGWQPIVVSDLKALAQIPDPSANALIRRFKGNFLENLQAIQILLEFNPARAVCLLVRVCTSYNGVIVKTCAGMLENVLKEYPGQIDIDDLGNVVSMKEDLVTDYHPGSGLANSTRQTIPSLPIRSLAKVELDRRSVK